MLVVSLTFILEVRGMPSTFQTSPQARLRTHRMPEMRKCHLMLKESDSGQATEKVQILHIKDSYWLVWRTHNALYRCCIVELYT